MTYDDAAHPILVPQIGGIYQTWTVTVTDHATGALSVAGDTDRRGRHRSAEREPLAGKPQRRDVFHAGRRRLGRHGRGRAIR
ncbi:MAG: hypothetical protein MZV65_00930 [Chromatiales bacterium]|nr:hypothetical protein [Chromatiales bacterium]